jgi:hypothetical protein
MKSSQKSFSNRCKENSALTFHPALTHDFGLPGVDDWAGAGVE